MWLFAINEFWEGISAVAAAGSFDTPRSVCCLIFASRRVVFGLVLRNKQMFNTPWIDFARIPFRAFLFCLSVLLQREQSLQHHIRPNMSCLTRWNIDTLWWVLVNTTGEIDKEYNKRGNSKFSSCNFPIRRWNFMPILGWWCSCYFACWWLCRIYICLARPYFWTLFKSSTYPCSSFHLSC